MSILLKFKDGDITVNLINNRFPVNCSTYNDYITFIEETQNTEELSWKHKDYSVEYPRVLLRNDVMEFMIYMKDFMFICYLDFVGFDKNNFYCYSFSRIWYNVITLHNITKDCNFDWITIKLKNAVLEKVSVCEDDVEYEDFNILHSVFSKMPKMSMYKGDVINFLNGNEDENTWLFVTRLNNCYSLWRI